VLVGGLALAGRTGGGLEVVGVFALRDTADPVFRTVETVGFSVAELPLGVRAFGVLVMELSTRGRVGVVGGGAMLVLDGLREG